MKKRAKKGLNRKLNQQEIVFIIVVAMLVSFLTIWFISANFGDELNLSPRLFIGPPSSSVRVPGVTGIGACPIGGCAPIGGSGALRWSWTPPSAVSFNTISFGDSDLKIFSGSVGHLPSPFIFSADDTDPVNPLFSYSGSILSSNKKTASAKNVASYVEYRQRGTYPNKIASVRKYSPDLSSIEWERDFTGFSSSFPGGIAVSDDGNRIVAFSYGNPFGPLLMKVLDSQGNGYEVDLSAMDSLMGQLNGQNGEGYALSGDGSRVFVMSSLKWMILELGDTSVNLLGSCYAHNNIYYPRGSVAINYDGSRAVAPYARGEPGHSYSYLGVFEEPFSSGVCWMGYNHEIQVPGDRISSSYGVAISDDGTHAVYGATGFGVGEDTNTNIISLSLSDISSPQFSYQLLMNYFSPGDQGEKTNRVVKVSMTPDGERFVAGLWGDLSHFSPEIMVFDKGQSSPADIFSTPGSIADLEISDDGTQFTASVYHRHASQGVHTDSLRVYDI
ncbi:hypothetical protein HN604_04080 [archaeon]|jgi:hypothetical protein|nr:hypothetical protein [archaeon]MBT6182385.1 hypothetical protein [archaeon]MBT6606389.1 hypothetical protein [archaeon]MBT7251442.1 hypothetical protein [archaeon]MBT7661227.1 hypothetical protein [archaeon]